MPRRSSVLLVSAALCAGPLAACADEGDGDSAVANRDTDTSASGTTPTADAVDEQRFPDIVAVDASTDGDTWRFSVTVSSPYDTPERYADGWRVVGPDGEVYGEHMLMHDHAGEQPFTRTQTGVVIPDDVDEVVVEGRDQRYGYGGGTATVVLDRS